MRARTNSLGPHGGNMRARNVLMVIAWLVATAAVGAAQAAPTTEDRIKALEDRIIALEGEVRMLRAAPPATAPAAQPAAAATAPAVATAPAQPAPTSVGTEAGGNLPVYSGSTGAS